MNVLVLCGFGFVLGRVLELCDRDAFYFRVNLCEASHKYNVYTCIKPTIEVLIFIYLYTLYPKDSSMILLMTKILLVVMTKKTDLIEYKRKEISLKDIHIRNVAYTLFDLLSYVYFLMGVKEVF